MSPSKREREYARQRYAKWQQRRETKAERRRRLRQRFLTAAAVVAVVALVGTVFWLSQRDGDDAETTAADPASQPTEAADQPVPDPSLAENRTWTATVETSQGPISLELYGDKAPQSVASFVNLTREGFFDGIDCHRLTTSGIFVLQCGDPTGTGSGGPGYQWGPVENAPADDSYPAGTLAMARQGGKADSQGSQFFVVYQDSTIPSDAAGGYSVFGRVTAGLDVVQKVADGGLAEDGVAPKLPISIEGVTVQ